MIERQTAARATVLFVLFVVAWALLPTVAAQSPGQTTVAESEQVIGSPDIDITASENRLQTGETQTVSVQIANSGDITRAGSSQLEQRVTTARNVRFEVEQHSLPDGMEIRSGPVLLGRVPEGGAGPISFRFDVSDGIDSGTYEVPVKVSYDYTRLAERTSGGQTRYRDFSTEQTKHLTLVVEDDARFILEPVSSEVIAGGTGDFVVEIENNGVETARNPRIVMTSGEGGVFFGGLDQRLAQTTVGFGNLDPGERVRVNVRAGASADLSPTTYPVDATIRYDTPGGVARESPPETLSMSVGEEQEFAVEGVESTLRVGNDGDLTGEIRNRGPRNVTNAVVVFSPENDNINPRATQYAVGNLGVGDSAEFEYRVSVSSEAERGPKQSEAVVRYRNQDGDQRTSSPVDVSYDVAEERDEFDLRTNVTVEAGSSDEVEVEVTNALNQTLTDIQAQVFTDDPLSSGDDEAYISSLEPGETTTMVFGMSVAGGATPKSYSASVDFRYDDERDETQISETYRVPVEVTEASAGGPPWLLILLIVGLIAGVGWWRRDDLSSLTGTDDSIGDEEEE